MAELTEQDAGAVRQWLESNQFQHVSTVGGDSEGFGDRQDVWERDGTLVRLTRDRGQWWYDLSRSGTNNWLDVDSVNAALGYKQTSPVERVQVAGAVDDRMFSALLTAVRPSP
ncbi:hypothetical protein [Oryzihumus leptocrescens]|uniref:Uncharacterized protein n=1 Tax=Oryzihumus leptocrescens TaxID=297536 RepID=A0A542ZIC5_9MICO|nr:hypothetical protein [Oryzihumus leptocrescens]TQL60118.1 hypothetical protein FB474_1500 [Oryzihumus leptocrescens]